MARINEEGYIEVCRKEKSNETKQKKHHWKNVFIPRIRDKFGVLYLGKTISVHPNFVGKRIRIKVEIIGG